jgi:hypothetical protein
MSAPGERESVCEREREKREDEIFMWSDKTFGEKRESEESEKE